MMRIEASFCVSHGDEMKIIGCRVYASPDSSPAADSYMTWFYEEMAKMLVTGVAKERQGGRLGLDAHLVTHLEDR